MEQAVRTALLVATWGKDEQSACAAAEYLMDKGDYANPAVPRGLILGRRWWRGSGQDTIRRLRTLLDNPIAHQLTVDALLAALYEEERRSPEFDLVSLLVVAGAPLYDRILATMAEAAKHQRALASLALLALTGRQDEAIQAAKRFGFAELAELISG